MPGLDLWVAMSGWGLGWLPFPKGPLFVNQKSVYLRAATLGLKPRLLLVEAILGKGPVLPGSCLVARAGPS